MSPLLDRIEQIKNMELHFKKFHGCRWVGASQCHTLFVSLQIIACSAPQALSLLFNAFAVSLPFTDRRWFVREHSWR
ncbi:hypothetical protein B9Y65_05805 [Stenotrophomonas maltophilia]|nr:hypothetical protein B9Y57_05805 [Stenotrophomonas maltophilia]PJL30034.1 hypothetical protein B9Y65_05805 [Stenotrophomonas maltophilia]